MKPPIPPTILRVLAMTVGKLIEMLEKMPKDATVYIQDPDVDSAWSPENVYLDTDGAVTVGYQTIGRV
jgi:hypothetical protein